MTKMPFERAVLAAGALAMLASALPAAALEPQTDLDWRTTQAMVKDANAPESACARMTSMSAPFQAKLDELRAKIEARRDERGPALAERRGEHTAEKGAQRKEWEERWETRIAELEAQASTDAQRAAIAQFKTEMQAAFNIRIAAVGVATAAFRTGIDKAVEARKTAVQKAVDTLRTTVKSLFAKATSDCAAGVPSGTVRANLKAGLEAAHAKFRTDMQAIEKVGAEAKALAETRNAAVRKAHEEYKVAAEAAHAKLKAALKRIEESATSTNGTSTQ